MASQYQHRQFFRRVPNALLAEYFKAKKISLGVDLGELKETEVEPIFGAFTALPEDRHIDRRVYDLDPLADPDFEFQFPAASGISKAVVNKMRLTLKGGSRRRVVLEADTKSNPLAVYELLKELRPPHYFITQVGIKVEFEPEKGKRPGTRAFNITHPNSCNLTYEGRDASIREMLVASGIEPRPVKAESSA